MAKNVDYRMKFVKDDNRDAVATVRKNGKVDVNINIHNRNIEIVRHFDNIEDAIAGMEEMGYINGVRESV